MDREDQLAALICALFVKTRALWRPLGWVRRIYLGIMVGTRVIISESFAGSVVRIIVYYFVSAAFLYTRKLTIYTTWWWKVAGRLAHFPHSVPNFGTELWSIRISLWSAKLNFAFAPLLKGCSLNLRKIPNSRSSTLANLLYFYSGVILHWTYPTRKNFDKIVDKEGDFYRKITMLKWNWHILDNQMSAVSKR